MQYKVILLRKHICQLSSRSPDCDPFTSSCTHSCNLRKSRVWLLNSRLPIQQDLTLALLQLKAWSFPGLMAPVWNSFQISPNFNWQKSKQQLKSYIFKRSKAVPITSWHCHRLSTPHHLICKLWTPLPFTTHRVSSLPGEDTEQYSDIHTQSHNQNKSLKWHSSTPCFLKLSPII